MGHTIAPTSFTVSFQGSQSETAPLEKSLSKAWAFATGERSRLFVTEEVADIKVVFETGKSEASGGVRTKTRGIAFIGPPYTANKLLHEIGHILGCCYGPGTSLAHFDTQPWGIMTDPVCVECLTFSERELAQMGLGRMQ